MSNQHEPNDRTDPLLKMPAEWDKGSGVDSTDATAFDRAIRSLLTEGVFGSVSPTIAPTCDLADVPGPSSSPGNSSEYDPLNPGSEVWRALAHEVEEEEKEKLHASHLHHPLAPEELPDISNL